MPCAYPGQRFGGAGGIAPPLSAGRWGKVFSELPYSRHRTRRDQGAVTAPVGRVTIGYADGHAAMRSAGELADPVTGKSTLDSLWSPIDAAINQ